MRYTLDNSGHCIGKLCSCVFAQVAIQPITWQQLKAFRLCRHGEDDLLKHKVTLEECGIVVGGRRAALGVSQTADLWDFHRLQGLQRTVPKREKYPMSKSRAEEIVRGSEENEQTDRMFAIPAHFYSKVVPY